MQQIRDTLHGLICNTCPPFWFWEGLWWIQITATCPQVLMQLCWLMTSDIDFYLTDIGLVAGANASADFFKNDISVWGVDGSKLLYVLVCGRVKFTILLHETVMMPLFLKLIECLYPVFWKRGAQVCKSSCSDPWSTPLWYLLSRVCKNEAPKIISGWVLLS